VKLGAWESGRFIGVVLFGRGANNRMAQSYGLSQSQACELVRVALTKHDAPVSRIVSQAIKFVKKQSEGLRLVISYADPEQGHHGGIYQAGNWIYSGRSHAQSQLIIDGVTVHKRSAWAKYGTASPEKIAAITGARVKWSTPEWKHTYLMPLDTEMRERVLPLAKPYPKRANASEGKESSRSATSGKKGGASPTLTLQPAEEV
jgi:hypothetical protein